MDPPPLTLQLPKFSSRRPSHRYRETCSKELLAWIQRGRRRFLRWRSISRGSSLYMSIPELYRWCAELPTVRAFSYLLRKETLISEPLLGITLLHGLSSRRLAV